jgi:ABC-type phosphate transport system substrate-binding protein
LTCNQTSVQVSYTSTGSGTGKKLLSGNNVSFAGSDSAVSVTDKVVIARQQRMIPVFAAAVGLMYNHKQVWMLMLCMT